MATCVGNFSAITVTVCVDSQAVTVRSTANSRLVKLCVEARASFTTILVATQAHAVTRTSLIVTYTRKCRKVSPAGVR